MLIWYNPDINSYQQGDRNAFRRSIEKSINIDRFELIYEFEGAELSIASKILNSLHKARNSPAMKLDFQM